MVMVACTVELYNDVKNLINNHKQKNKVIKIKRKEKENIINKYLFYSKTEQASYDETKNSSRGVNHYILTKTGYSVTCHEGWQTV
jgi:hypothetical protein